MRKQDLDLRKALRSNPKDYASLQNLRFNPFPYANVSWDDEVFPTISDDIRIELQNFVLSSYNDQLFNALVVYGDFGSGKSHLLKYLQSQINNQLGAVGIIRAIAVLLDSPHPTTLEIVFAVLSEIGRSRFLKFLWQSVFQEFERDKIKKDYILNQIASMGTNSPTFEDYIKELNYQKFLIDLCVHQEFRLKLKGYVLSFVNDLYGSDYYAETVVALMFTDNERDSLDAWRAMTGKNTDESYKLANYFNAENQFSSLLSLLNKVGYSHLYLLIDEFSNISLSTGLENYTRRHLVNLDGLIRDNLEYFSIVIALPEGAWDTLKKLAPEFSRRFDHEIRLLPMSRKDAQGLVKEYLRKARIKEEDEGSFKPFTPTTIDRINAKSKGNVRKFLSYCYDVVEIAAQERVKTIDAKLVDLILKS